MSGVISIIVPVYQNVDSLARLVECLLGLAPRLAPRRLELLFVDDGSSDGSYERLCELRNVQCGVIKLLKLTRNFGQTPAIQAGLAHCSGDCAVIISADLQDPYECIPEMVEHWATGEKFVMCYRAERYESGIHKFISNLYWRMVATFALQGFPRAGYDFCLVDRQLISSINRLYEKNTSIFPLIFWLGFRPHAIPITRQPRLAGRSQWSLFKKTRITIDTIIAFTHLPSRIITTCALTSSFLSVLYMCCVIIRWLFLGSPVAGWTSLVLILTCFGSLTLLALGIICEYLWRILDESRKRPPYIIDEFRDVSTH